MTNFMKIWQNMANKKIPTQLIFNENLKRNAVSSFSKQLCFDDLGDFVQEREKIRRFVDQGLETELKVDYSNLSNHVFFDSAVSKFNIAKDRIEDKNIDRLCRKINGLIKRLNSGDSLNIEKELKAA